MDKSQVSSVTSISVNENNHLQRIDNYLITKLKGLPKSRLYKALRKGEIRVNKKRVKPDYKLQMGDLIRLPHFRLPEEEAKQRPSTRLCEFIKKRIISEDSDFIILNKPAGIAVHGGSGLDFGIIEILRSLYPRAKFLELIHRLDKETSGCLLIAKKSSVLKEVHRLLVERKVKKTYLMLVAGNCQFEYQTVDMALKKNIMKSGERIVVIDPDGKSAKTIFKCIKNCEHYSLLEARPITGRTHQLRVHAAYLGHPILGDQKYGKDESNKMLRTLGVNQLCLHSLSIELDLPANEQLGVCALLTEAWQKLL